MTLNQLLSDKIMAKALKLLVKVFGFGIYDASKKPAPSQRPGPTVNRGGYQQGPGRGTSVHSGSVSYYSGTDDDRGSIFGESFYTPSDSYSPAYTSYTARDSYYSGTSYTPESYSAPKDSYYGETYYHDYSFSGTDGPATDRYTGSSYTDYSYSSYTSYTDYSYSSYTSYTDYSYSSYTSYTDYSYSSYSSYSDYSYS